MRRLFFFYSALLAVFIIMVLVPLWSLLFLYGKGDGFSCSLSIGEIWYNTKILTVFTVVMAPSAVFALCCFLWRITKAPVPSGLKAVWGFCTFQATLFLALYLIFAAPWSSLTTMNWKEAVTELVQSPEVKASLTDEGLEFPVLPLEEEIQQDPYAWNLYDLDGNEVSMSQFRDKVIFLNVWATWCGYCRQEFPNIQRLHEAMRSNPEIAFIILSPEAPETVRGWADSQEFSLPFYTANRADIPEMYMPRGLPTTFIVVPGGRIAFRYSGAAAWDSEKTQQFLRGLADQFTEDGSAVPINAQ